MTIGGHSINTRDANDLGAGGMLPKGEYECIVKQAMLEPDKFGGQFVGFQFLIVEGAFKGRMIFERAYVYDPNGKRVNYGKSVFKGLGKVFGYPDDWSDAMVTATQGKRLIVVLDQEPASTGKDGKPYKARNTIEAFKAPAAAVAPMMQAALPMQPVDQQSHGMPAVHTQTGFAGFPQQNPLPAAQPMQPMPAPQQFASPAPTPVMQPQPAGQPPAFMSGALG